MATVASDAKPMASQMKQTARGWRLDRCFELSSHLGLGFEVLGLGVKVLGLGFAVSVLGFSVLGLGFKVLGRPAVS